MQRRVAAVIVTFNRLEKLKETLTNTFSEPFHSVVVVNNCSTDGTGEWLDQQAEPRLHVIHSPENQGGAGGFHQGFKYAAEELPEADWLVAFDDDAFPKSGTVNKFQELEIPDDVGSVAAAVYLPSGRISEMNRPSVNPFWHWKDFVATAFRGRSGFHMENEVYLRKKPIEIDASSFVGFFLRLDLIRNKSVGLPRSELFIYADDIIYVLELRKAGIGHLFVPWLEFSHDCQTLVNQKDVYRPLWRVYYTFRNRIEMFRVASGLFFGIVLLVKIPKMFLAYFYYKPEERRQFLTVTKQAVLDGIRRDYSKNFNQVLNLSSIPSKENTQSS